MTPSQRDTAGKIGDTLIRLEVLLKSLGLGDAGRDITARVEELVCKHYLGDDK